MNFERSKDPRKTIGIGNKEYAIHITEMLAKKKGFLPEYGRFPNNPEVITSWGNSSGSYLYLWERDQKYSVNYDFGVFEYGSMSIEDIKKILKIK